MPIPDLTQWKRDMDSVIRAFRAENPFKESLVKLTSEESIKELKVLVAATPQEKALGMMYRQFEGFDAMLFVEPVEILKSYHNRNVPVDLTIAWYNSQGELVDLQDMAAGSADPITPSGPYRYALEGPKGFVTKEEALNLEVIS